MRCPLCRRPADQCVCDHVRAVPTTARVTLLQHPGERHHAFNTARLTQRCLENAELHVAWPDDHGRMRAPVPFADDAVLLFPSPDATPADTWPPPRPSQLVVLDGTWTQVKRLLHDDPRLGRLPSVTLPPGPESRYRIREEPASHYLSTLEAVARVLAAWEPDAGAHHVLTTAFEALVDAHLEVSKAPAPRRRTRARPTVAERLADREHLVVVYAETAGLGTDRQLLQWAAVRPATGEVFDRIAHVEMDPCAREATGLPAPDGDLSDLRDAWHRWRHPDEHVFAWTSSVGRVAGPAGLGVGVFGLKTLYRRRPDALDGRLDAIVEGERLSWQPLAVRGRAAQRLAWCLAMARLLTP